MDKEFIPLSEKLKYGANGKPPLPVLIKKLQAIGSDKTKMRWAVERCHNIGPYLNYISNNDPKVRDALTALLNILLSTGIDGINLYEGIAIIIATHGQIKNKRIDLYHKYPEYFHKLALYLVGDEEIPTDYFKNFDTKVSTTQEGGCLTFIGFIFLLAIFI